MVGFLFPNTSAEGGEGVLMTEKGEKFGEEFGKDEDVADITAKLVGLGSPEKMKMAYDAAKKALKKKGNEEKAEAKVAEKVAAAVAKVKAKEAAAVAKKEKALIGVVPEDILVRLAGNSGRR
jgi:hypothetical protein